MVLKFQKNYPFGYLRFGFTVTINFIGVAVKNRRLKVFRMVVLGHLLLERQKV